MSKVGRLKAVLAGEASDRPPISFWRHSPRHDRTAPDLVKATVGFQRRYDLDLVKLTPSAMYCVLDYGATDRLVEDDESGTTRLASSPIRSPADWAALPRATPDRGALGMQVDVIRGARRALGGDVPLVFTLFSPLSMAAKLAGPRFRDHLHEHTERVEAALGRFVEDTIAFGVACLDSGADGVFFAVQHSGSQSGVDAATFEELGVPFDLRVLEALRDHPRNWLTILHLHGAVPRFDLADRYPVHAVNWEDRDTTPSLAAAVGLTRRALFCGIDRRGPLMTGDPVAIHADVTQARSAAGGRPIMLAPGCTIPTTVSPTALDELRRTVDGPTTLQGFA